MRKRAHGGPQGRAQGQRGSKRHLTLNELLGLRDREQPFNHGLKLKGLINSWSKLNSGQVCGECVGGNRGQGMLNLTMLMRTVISC